MIFFLSSNQKLLCCNLCPLPFFVLLVVHLLFHLSTPSSKGFLTWPSFLNKAEKNQYSQTFVAPLASWWSSAELSIWCWCQKPVVQYSRCSATSAKQRINHFLWPDVYTGLLSCKVYAGSCSACLPGLPRPYSEKMLCMLLSPHL